MTSPDTPYIDLCARQDSIEQTQALLSERLCELAAHLESLEAHLQAIEQQLKNNR